MRRDPRAYLHDVIEAADSIARFVGDSDRIRYESDALLQAGVERKFTIIGEALSQLSKLYPDVAGRVARLREISGFRNLLIHAYTSVDQRRVWTIMQQSLPELRVSAKALLDDLSNQGS